MRARNEPSFVVRQEPDRLDRRRLAWISVFTFASFALAIATSSILLRAEEGGRDVGPTEAPPAQVGTVETTLILGSERGITLREKQRAALDTYGWVDRDAGRARIPIDRAVDLLVERGAANDGGARP